jgi:hypothetical protein
MATVADVLKRIERIKKDLEYVRTFQDKWRDQRERFPKIYEGILEQERFFLRKIDELKGLRVDSIESLASEPEATPQPAPAIVPAEVPVAQVSPAPTGPSTDSGDEKRAATIDVIGEKLRKRSKSGEPAAVAADAGLSTDSGK